ncbi:MAG: DUF5131 family protein [Vicinamibacterales bacterium]
MWLGVSVENQHFADERIPLLLQTPAAVRFISAEPLLEGVNMNQWLLDEHGRRHIGAAPGLTWVIVGGESGPGARPCRVAWIRDIVQQCHSASVRVFVKQLGARPEGDPRPPERRDPVTGARVLTVMQQIEISDRKGADMAEWPEELRVRECPEFPR